MSTPIDRYDRAAPPRSLHHPLHAFLIAASVPLFLGALLSDIAYAYSYQLQWLNFASWLIAGGLVFGAIALVWALVGLFGARRDGAPALFIVLLVTWIVGFIDALIHARDAWAVMPTAPWLSAITFLLASIATWLVFARLRDTRVLVGGVA